MKLSLHQVAQSLALPIETVERWIRQGRIPIRRHSDDCIFDIKILEKWATHHNLSFTVSPDCDQNQCITHDTETLLAAMQLGGTYYNIEGDTAQSALASAVANVPGLSHQSKVELYHLLIEREMLASTGIGRGIAIPHPRTPISTSLSRSQITTCFLQNPINYNAVDDQPVFMFFILLSPSVKNHLNLLSRLSYCVRNNDFVNLLRKRPDPQVIFQEIEVFEHALDKNG